MTYTRKNKGVCSKSTTVKLNGDIIETIEVDGGCEGNLKGICALLTGTPAQEAIQRMRGIRCGSKKTSCPDQISHCLEEAIHLEKTTDKAAVAVETQID